MPNTTSIQSATEAAAGMRTALATPGQPEASPIADALQRAILNSANFSSIATDAQGVIQIFNVGAERMLGYAAADVMNKITPADIFDPREVIERAQALSNELDTTIAPGFEALVFKAARGIEDIYELTYIRKDGSRFPAVVSVTALRDAQNAIIGYLLIGTDNTARKQIETQQKQLRQRLRDNQFYMHSLFESTHHDVLLYCTVRDMGIGLTAAQTGQLLQSFSQADASTTRKYGGTGLGLVIAKNPTELMSGKVGGGSERRPRAARHSGLRRLHPETDPLPRTAQGRR